jgi:hypothetical protein
VDPIFIHLGPWNTRILIGDLHGVDIGINVSFTHELSRLLVELAIITSLFCWETVKTQTE